jgi:DNA-binding CsgD family transcriptional regulator/tetratricopeptide (TPR) repeat protein
MPATRVLNRLLLSGLFVFLQTNYFSFSQNVSYPYSEWIQKLSDQNGPINSGVDEVLSFLLKTDSSQAIAALNELEERGSHASKYFAPRFNLLKANWLMSSKNCAAIGMISDVMKRALYAAYETNNDSLISEISWHYGNLMFSCLKIEPAAIYCLNAVELDEKKGIKTSTAKFGMLGDILYKTHDYEKSIYYTGQAILTEADTVKGKGQIMSWHNTNALCWQKLGQFDSALHYYNIARQMAQELHNYAWVSLISGNIGQVYYLQGKYDVAKSFLEFDYKESKKYGELLNAANTQQWLARTNLALGKKDSALIQIKGALGFLQKYSEYDYLQNACYAASEVYMAFGMTDSVYKYFRMYIQLRNSSERDVANSRLEIARIKLDNLQNEMTIKNLNKEKDAEKLKRNFMLGFIVMFAAIVILVLNRQRQRSIHKQELTLKEKTAAETEIAAAKEQLNMFKQNVIEKTDLIEKLEAQVHYKEMTVEQSEIADELSRQTILTEEDWDKFKKLFEKIYPGFFMKLRDKAPDITLAEQRMAALTRLHLTSKQIASMLGISVDSVHKSRQRLRQRLQLHVDTNLEETIAGL